MNHIPFQPKLGLVVLLVGLITGCSGHISGQNASEPQGISGEASRRQASEVSDGASGLIVHIDPKTGQLITPSTGALPAVVAQPPADTTKKSPAELRQVPSPVPGGGVLIELDERFQTPLTATIHADGKVKLEHKSVTPESDDKK